MGCSRVNSSSKLLVSAVPFYNAWVRYASSSRGAATYDSGEVGRGYALVQYIVEVDVLEECMPLDVLSVRLTRPKPPGRVARQELSRRLLNVFTY